MKKIKGPIWYSVPPTHPPTPSNKYIPIGTSANSESTNINTVYTCISQTLFYTVVGSVPSVPSNKTTAGFQKGGLPMRILKPPVPLPTPTSQKNESDQNSTSRSILLKKSL